MLPLIPLALIGAKSLSEEQRGHIAEIWRNLPANIQETYQRLMTPELEAYLRQAADRVAKEGIDAAVRAVIKKISQLA